MNSGCLLSHQDEFSLIQMNTRAYVYETAAQRREYGPKVTGPSLKSAHHLSNAQVPWPMGLFS